MTMIMINHTSCDRSLDVAKPADLEVCHGVSQVIGGECEERKERRAHDLGTALNNGPITHAVHSSVVTSIIHGTS